MSDFVDHLQILPVPSVGGVRQPDGDHRPGGLGMMTLAERLAERGWTARVEDIGFDKPLPERRIAEAYARSIGDAVLSAWDRDRFPIVLTRVNYGALGVVDALGERTGVLWTSPRTEYRSPGLLRRPKVDRTALAMVTGRTDRDDLAVQPVRLSGSRVVVLGGWESSGGERKALAEDGVRILARESLDDLDDGLAGVDADPWYVHVDLTSLAGEAVPAADERRTDGLDPGALAAAIGEAMKNRDVRCVGFARYDLNRDEGGRTVETLVDLIETVVRAAGGEPRPGAVREAVER